MVFIVKYLALFDIFSYSSDLVISDSVDFLVGVLYNCVGLCPKFKGNLNLFLVFVNVQTENNRFTKHFSPIRHSVFSMLK